MQILFWKFFFYHEQVPHGPQFHPIKFYILNQNLQKPTPQNQENFGQLVCSRLANVAYYTDICPVQFCIWPVDDSKNKLLEVYLFYMVFGGTCQVFLMYLTVPCNLLPLYNLIFIFCVLRLKSIYIQILLACFFYLAFCYFLHFFIFVQCNSKSINFEFVSTNLLAY